MKRLLQILRRPAAVFVILSICCVLSIVFVRHNYSFYDRPIAKVTGVTIEETDEMEDMHGNQDELITQKIEAVIQNGAEKGQTIELHNQYSKSGAYDHEYDVGNDLFVTLDKNADSDELGGIITDLKRDHYVTAVIWIFIFALWFVGRKQGLLAIAGFTVNVLLLSFALDLYVEYSHVSLLLICAVCILLFTAISLLLVSGFNEKTYAAIAATIIATAVSLGITALAIWVTGGNGLRYEEMQFLTRPYHAVFMAGLFIGSLGAIMDVAITMSSSIFALYERDQEISNETLKASGMDIGKDVMGTITSILFFAYISGSIPMLILFLKNMSPLGYAFSMNLSLELARALAGGIGIVLTIPIGLYTTLFFIERRRARA